jgi:hypothetical protein
MLNPVFPVTITSGAEFTAIVFGPVETFFEMFEFVNCDKIMASAGDLVSTPAHVFPIRFASMTSSSADRQLMAAVWHVSKSLLSILTFRETPFGKVGL